MAESPIKDDRGYSQVLHTLTNLNDKAASLAGQFSKLNDIVAMPRIMSAMKDINLQYAQMRSLDEFLPKIDSKVFESPLLKLSREANIAFSNLATSSDVSLFAPSTLKQTSEWLRHIGSVNTTLESLNKPLKFFASSWGDASTFVLSKFAINASLAKMVEISTLSEKYLSYLDMTDLSKQINALSGVRQELSSSLYSFTSSYSQLSQSLQYSPKQITEVGPMVFKLTPVEYFNEIDLLQYVSLEDPLKADGERIRYEITEENRQDLCAYLPKVNKELLKLWEGASHALESDNPDRIRHFAVSMRELFTHLLHEVAPDQEIMQWTTDQKYFYNGKPTRVARLMYICRDIHNESFHDFVEKDIEATLGFLNLLQGGTHAISSGWTQSQLMALKARAESTIRYIIEISRYLFR